MNNSLNILLIEDEVTKRNHIDSFLRKFDEHIDILHAKSVNSAFDALDNLLPDLLILDMSLPTFDMTDSDNGGRPQGFGGKEVMRYMSMEKYNCPVIILTGYESFPTKESLVDLSQLENELRKEFPEFLLDVLHFSSVYDIWKDELTKILCQLITKLERS